jgi:hypothetical protein
VNSSCHQGISVDPAQRAVTAPIAATLVGLNRSTSLRAITSLARSGGAGAEPR